MPASFPRLSLLGVLAASALAFPASQVRGSQGPCADFSCVLGRPSDQGVVLNLVSAKPLFLRVDCRPSGAPSSPAAAATQTPSTAQPLSLRAGEPVELELTGLQPDASYHYRLLKANGDAATAETVLLEADFHTQRRPGSSFTFSLQGDSHPEREGKMFEPRLYERTLRQVASEHPDFYLLMGDDFSIERQIASHQVTEESIAASYRLQRGFLGLLGPSTPLFLVNGNHEQAALANLDGSALSPAALAGRLRTRFFSLPAPDRFYTGDATPLPQVGLPRDYYAWTWGDALFVVIDFYWHSPVTVDNEAGARGGQRNREEAGDKPSRGDKGGKGGDKGAQGGQGEKGHRNRDLWQVTLGDEQYHWLAQTLAQSKARWKFVFCHHVLGTGRGGIEEARLYEWGGQDHAGQAGQNHSGADNPSFASHRPGWEAPIHELFRRYGVSIFFQGHDHLYAHQELDGVTYQEVPNPADASYSTFNSQAYRSGRQLPNSGHLRVQVSPDAVKVDYLRSFLPGDEPAGFQADTPVESYTLHKP